MRKRECDTQGVTFYKEGQAAQTAPGGLRGGKGHCGRDFFFFSGDNEQAREGQTLTALKMLQVDSIVK